MKKIFVPFIFCIIYFWASTSMAEWRPIRLEYDNDNNGLIDRALFYTYDSDGNETKLENDIGNDGSIDQVLYRTYDSNGDMIKQEHDSDNDGSIDQAWFYTYDGDGNLIKEENDEDNDGSIDEVWFYTYDSEGNLIEEEFNGGIGLNWAYFNTYDSDGNMIKREFGYYVFDWFVDGRILSLCRVTFYNYDTNGNRIKTEDDNDYDGSIDEVYFYTYDSNGNLIKYESDYNNDGSIDMVSFYTYDSDGNLIKEETDHDNDGLIDSVYFNTYDLNGNMIKREHDRNNDGSTDWVVYITSWEYTLQPWLQIGGEIAYEGIPLCAMVLANGHYMFTCGDNSGGYSLDVPLDENGEITLYGFVSGFSPFKISLSPGRALDFDISMTRAAADTKNICIIVQTELGTTNPDWIRISGTVAYDVTPLCAMIITNGQSMFSCGDDLGTFDLEVPLDENGEITLYVFCSGFAPYKQVFVP